VRHSFKISERVIKMSVAAENALQEPEHELTVVQQVQRGSISSTGSKALLTVKLPGAPAAWYLARIRIRHHSTIRLHLQQQQQQINAAVAAPGPLLVHFCKISDFVYP
jgi:hypothetical protein